MSRAFLVCPEPVREITASIGIAGVTPDPDDNDLKTLAESLIARADVALYRSKAKGRNQVTVDDSE